jgi:hypothetical protein
MLLTDVLKVPSAYIHYIKIMAINQFNDGRMKKIA